MSDHDAESYASLWKRVQAPSKKLASVIDQLEVRNGKEIRTGNMFLLLQAKKKEREWVKHQTSGDLDDGKLIEGVTGEQNIYRFYSLSILCYLYFNVPDVELTRSLTQELLKPNRNAWNFAWMYLGQCTASMATISDLQRPWRQPSWLWLPWMEKLIKLKYCTYPTFPPKSSSLFPVRDCGTFRRLAMRVVRQNGSTPEKWQRTPGHIETHDGAHSGMRGSVSGKRLTKSPFCSTAPVVIILWKVCNMQLKKWLLKKTIMMRM